MNSVLVELCRWGATLPYWEQVALDRIISGVVFEDADYDELLQYLLEDEGLAERKGNRQPVSFTTPPKSPERTDFGPIRLLSISNLQNVNALMSGQRLTFGPALTTIFGANGSGKSGYARVLGRAGFTRGDIEVLPDVAQPGSDLGKPSAELELEMGDSKTVVQFQVGSRCPALSSFYVFDSTSVMAHLTKADTINFSPAGLAHFGRLSQVTDQVRERLQAMIEKRSTYFDLTPLFRARLRFRR